MGIDGKVGGGMGLLATVLWATAANYGARRHRGLTAGLLATGLACSMGSQLWLLHLDGQLSLQTGLPLHLCSFSAIACVLLCLRFHCGLYHFVLLLGVPGAILALIFPTVVPSSHPALMKLAFLSLHALIPATAAFFFAQQKPLPSDPRNAFLLGNGLVLLAACANGLTGSNYLFLHAAPQGTPLAWLIRHGYAVYIAGLEILCMLMMKLLCALYLRKVESI